MADKKAKIEIGLEGTNEVVEGATKLLSSFTLMGVGLATVAMKGKEVIDTLNKVRGIKMDVSLEETTNKFRTFQESVDVVQRQTGLAADIIKKKLESINLATGIKLPELASSVSAFGEKTGDMQGSLDALQQRATHANNLAISLKEADENALVLMRDLNTPSKELSKTYQFVKELAKENGISPRVLEQQITAAGPTLRRFDTTTEAKRREALTMVADINRDIDPERGRERLQALTAGLVNNVQGMLTFDRLHGDKFHPVDSLTHRLNIEALPEIQKFIKGRGSRKAQEQIAGSFTGSQETASVFLDFDFSKLSRGIGKQFTDEKAVESFGIQKAKAEAAEESYDRNKGGLFTLFGKAGAEMQAEQTGAREARERRLAQLSPEKQEAFLEKERSTHNWITPKGWIGNIGGLIDIAHPGQRIVDFIKPPKEENEGEEPVKNEHVDVLKGIHTTLQSIDGKLTPDLSGVDTRKPSIGAQ